MKEFALDVQNISVRYGIHRALEEVSLQAPAGSFVAVLGPNGSGKTTLLKVLVGIIPPTMGQVRLFGQPAGQGRGVGYVPQVKTLDRSFPALARELVVSGLVRRWPFRPQRADEEVLGVLKRVGAAHLADRPLSGLSGGELQRIYLARSLIRKPQLILLDEPATGIDAVGEADLYLALESYQREENATVVMVTHDWHVAEHHATHVLLLNQGLVSFGPPAEALAEHNLRRAFGHVGHHHQMLGGGRPHA